MTRRMAIAMLALIGTLIALYLTLYKVGIIGTLACSTLGNCETVQLSRWATFLGLPVAAWGVGYYVSILLVAMLGLQERWADSPVIGAVLALLTGWGVLFSGWLTYLELFVIHAICVWCVTSAALVLLLFALSVAEWRMTSAQQPDTGA